MVNNHTDISNEPIDKDLKIGELIEIKMLSVNDGKLSYKVERVRIAGFLYRKWILNNFYGRYITVIMTIEELSKLANINDVNVIGVKASSGKEKEVENKIEKMIGNKYYNNLESRARKITGNLDTKSTEGVMSTLREYVNDYNKTLIMITHNDNIAKEADICIKIKDGKISN